MEKEYGVISHPKKTCEYCGQDDFDFNMARAIDPGGESHYIHDTCCLSAIEAKRKEEARSEG